MDKFLTYDEMAKNIAKKALDEFLYDGRSIREWMQIIVSEDCISRKDLIRHIENQSREWGEDYDVQQILGDIEDFPSVKPQESTVKFKPTMYLMERSE